MYASAVCGVRNHSQCTQISTLSVRVIAPVRRFGPPLADQIRPMAYTALQSLMDTAYPRGHQYYQKDHFLLEISDEAIDIMVEHFACVSSPLSIPFLQQSGGAMRRGHTAYAHRAALYNLVLTAQWLDPGESDRHVCWTRELWQALRPYATGGIYVNHIGHEDGADQVRATYGTYYQRLAELKQKYDPTNLFRHNQNIKPTG